MAYQVPNSFIALFSRPCFVPALYHLHDESSDERAFESTESKVGGIRPFFYQGEVDWPACGECGKPMTFIIQLSLEKVSQHPLYVEKTGGEGLFQLFVCLPCDEQEVSLDQNTYLARLVNTKDLFSQLDHIPCAGHPAEGTQTTLYLSSIHPPTSHPDLTILKECAILDWDQCHEIPHIYEIEGSEEALRYLGLESDDPRLDEICEYRLHPKPGSFKVFGWPYWIQAEDYPRCKVDGCGHPMHCLLQLAECEMISYMWGDCGIASVFQCPDHQRSFHYTWESS
ncbi:hypothetical protein K493DRAFT_301865 [Basidiobolus meristosporus CBS 931.73]|uniref:Programmed cell death protein 2 C-terminal domain-containing protein n=1 Tax=Basidiobolus meristosporus CBS 931.73 TaxID=1314790 RepID=A0A1Y1XCV5_9FUNG|nr:hypothetical protein K493DRAFT_307588 [Basidiobolus meristosporus CBS 931.73]ORX94775.1 hypothetical protein K493DRAFT_301865 [Basidiobolus meristosporus CBS 931.73]|eukprot:ORX83555.1 hypothetical protein K493DRAFT_307588 [Basidiobolus meristosporus CBS 931.73]